MQEKGGKENEDGRYHESTAQMIRGATNMKRERKRIEEKSEKKRGKCVQKKKKKKERPTKHFTVRTPSSASSDSISLYARR